jgi:hypothetical protein
MGKVIAHTVSAVVQNTLLAYVAQIELFFTGYQQPRKYAGMEFVLGEGFFIHRNYHLRFTSVELLVTLAP